MLKNQLSNIELAKTQNKNSVVIEKKTGRFGKSEVLLVNLSGSKYSLPKKEIM